MSTNIHTQPVSPAGIPIPLVLMVCLTTLVPILAIYKYADAFRHHPFSLIQMVAVVTVMPWYLRLYFRKRAEIQAMDGSPEIKAVAMDLMTRGIVLTAVSIILCLSAMRFIA